MKRASLLLAALIATAPVFAQDDSGGDSQEFLKNSTFTDGTTYWHGDCKPAGSDMSTDFVTGGPGANGIMVELHPSTWTNVTQEIRARSAPSNAQLTITYQVSSDFKLSDRDTDYTNCGPNVGFGGANIPSRPGKLVAFFDVPPASRSSVVNTGGGYSQVTIFNDDVASASFAPSTAQSPQTFTVHLGSPPPTPDNHQTFCLAIPPGNGSITITKISLTAAQ